MRGEGCDFACTQMLQLHVLAAAEHAHSTFTLNEACRCENVHDIEACCILL